MKVIKIFLLTVILVSFTACSNQSDIDEAVATAVAEALATPPIPTPTELPIYIGSPAKSGHVGGYGDYFGSFGWRLQAKVLRVIDGDTIEVEGVDDMSKQLIPKGTKVRYLDIDAPETVHPYKPVQCYGPEATLRNKQLVEGKTVTLSRYEDDGQTVRNSFDNDGRLLAYVYTDEYFVNGELVWSGFAYAYKESTPGGEVRDTFFFFRQNIVKMIFNWELNAEKNKRGLWGKCS